MHIDALQIDVNQQINANPLVLPKALSKVMWIFLGIGLITYFYGLYAFDPKQFWGAYYTNAIFFLGLSLGSCLTSAIFQIVGAVWSIPIRRIAEAGASFLPFAWILFMGSYLGKDYLFPWGNAPMPGREWWMQANFVYLRYGILLGFLMFLMTRFINMSLRRDVGLIRESAKKDSYFHASSFDGLTANWQGIAKEGPAIQEKMNWNAPLIVAVYAVVMSLVAFDMIMGMDKIWYSTMFGGFIFVGNVYIAWAALGLFTVYAISTNPGFKKMVGGQQWHDLGKLTFGFCILWTYLFFSQFLPIWYGNLPEETQWMILRVRENPWRVLSWICFGMCFVTPFILLLSKELKKTPFAYGSTCLIILVGVWLERYILVMPQLTGSELPIGLMEVGMTLGFVGAYILCVKNFLSKVPLIAVSHPYLHESHDH